MLLALNYAATPGDAYDSVLYISHQVAGGKLIRGLHHWGSSAMIVVVALHAAQVFIYGAYKKPREVVWLSGVFLLFLVLAFGLTGYLLPWDNRAYWGTMVTTQIAAQTPVVGSYLQHWLGAKNGVGVVTFSRFYAFHVLFLPATTAVLIGSHLLFVRKHGVAPAANDELSTNSKGREPAPPKSFFPGQVLRDTVAIFVAFAAIFIAAALLDVPLERMADPTDLTYVPRPEWYFLFLFQALKLFEGPFEAVGSIGIPLLAVAALVSVPFIDRGKVAKVQRRSVAISIACLAAAGWTALTVAAIQTTPSRPVISATAVQSQRAIRLPAEELAALLYFREGRCQKCHNLAEGDPKPGPSLAGHEVHHSPDWLEDHFQTSIDSKNGAKLPAMQVNALLIFSSRLTPEDSLDLTGAPPQLLTGASVYVANLCTSCHKVNGVGGQTGPALNGLSSRRSQNWVKRHFLAPKILSPGTIMPPYRLAPADQEALVSYLFQLP